MLSLKSVPNYKDKVYAIDGANICGIELNSHGKPKLDNLKLLIN